MDGENEELAHIALGTLSNPVQKCVPVAASLLYTRIAKYYYDVYCTM